MVEEDQIDYIALHPKENAFDFPCSYAYRAFYQEMMYGEYLPSIEPNELILQDRQSPVTEYRVVKVHDKQLTRKVNDLEGIIKYLLKKEEDKQKRHRGKYF